jgi:hypothetical protein
MSGVEFVVLIIILYLREIDTYPIDTKKPVKYGTSQITQTRTLNLWKLAIAFSSLRISTMLAQAA